MSLSIFGNGPKLTSAEQLYWVINPCPAFFGSSLKLAMMGSPNMLTVGGSMIADSFRLTGHSTKQCWKNKHVSLQSVKQGFQAGGLAVGAVYCLSVGLFFPKSVVSVRHLLGAPRLTTSFKLARLFTTYAWDGGMGSLIGVIRPANWLVQLATVGLIGMVTISKIAALVPAGVLQAGVAGGVSTPFAMLACQILESAHRRWQSLDI